MDLDRYIGNRSGYDQNKKIGLTIEYINNHYQEFITIDLLSEMVNVTPQYFCKIFKEATNKRPFEYINTVRIQKSKELMLNTNMTIHAISKAVGFENPSYYGKWFKQVESTTPGKFRSHYRS
jgi:YesN/AraC family two-component response regulator